VLTASLMDYALPRADDLPGFAWETIEIPATTNPLGVKGCGEAGCAGAMPAVLNAVNDALSHAGAGPMDMPTTPERVWQALRRRNTEP
jgi:carbon-monoxide dehydrogenase large subunit